MSHGNRTSTRSHTPAAALCLCVGLLAGGCTATVHTGATVVAAPAPTLVAIDGGVWVVADYDDPVFFYSNTYWRWAGGVWYRSSYVNSGWVRVQVNVVPAHVRRIEHPRRYVHYHAPRGARTRAVPERHVHHEPAPRGQARGHREEHPGRAEGHRDDHRDHRQDDRRQDDHRDHRQDDRRHDDRGDGRDNGRGH